MKTLIIGASVAIALIAPLEANAGCLAGAAAGGVAGHVAGHHAVLGAAGGCVAGHEYTKHKERKHDEEVRNQQYNEDHAQRHETE